jgi:hypothetical protein
MKRNRRNYYRILYVQPEAPQEIITASYRTLMGPLRQHPDRGGSHEAAALLNEAYAVLGDPARRCAYDRTLNKERLRRTPPAATAAPAADPAQWLRDHCCPFCRQPLPGKADIVANCNRCDAPLSAPPRPPSVMRELFGKRRSTRHPRKAQVVLYPAWGARPVAAELVDLSLTGMALLVPAAVPESAAIRVTDPGFDAVALVVACRQRAGRHVVHARLLTLETRGQRGMMVSVRA